MIPATSTHARRVRPRTLAVDRRSASVTETKLSRKRRLPRLLEGGHRRDRPGRRMGAEGAGERLAGEVEDAAVLADHEVSVAEAHHAGHGLVQPRTAHGAP